MKRKNILIFLLISLLILPFYVSANGKLLTEKSARDYRPEHLDAAIMLDRSYSMAGTKINQATTALGNFLGLLENDDEIGIGSYNHEAETNFNITLVTSPAVLQVAANSLNGLNITSLTSVGAGLVEGQSILSGASQLNPPQGLLLLSDGIENFSPMVAGVIGSIPTSTDVYTIAFGADSDQDLMNQIATITDGLYYYGAGDLSAICEEIITQMRGRDLVLKEAGTINLNNDMMIQYPVTVDQTDQIVFTLMWNQCSSILDFNLFDPNGNHIMENNFSQNNIEIVTNAAQKFIRIQDPTPGIYTANIKSIFIDPDQDDESYYFHVSTLSDLHMFSELDQTSYQLGESIGLQTQLLNNFSPVTEASVSADLYSFDTFIESVILYDDGQHNDVQPNDGIYGNLSSPLEIPETCAIVFNAESTSNSLNNFKRVKTHSTYIYGAEQNQLPVNNEVFVANNARSEATPTNPIDNLSNFPNPFNPQTKISFEIAKAGNLNITIFNCRGQKVTTLVDSYQDAGIFSKNWNGTNDQGGNVSSGIYYYTIKLGEYQETRKMVLMK